MQQDGFRSGWPELSERLYFAQEQGFWFVEYFGDGDEFWREFLQLLCAPEIAQNLRWLSLRGLDEGANGTRNWDFTPLLETNAPFPQLQSLQIARTSPEAHNHSTVGASYEESGQLASLLDRMPTLIELRSPSAPSAAFSERPPHPLRVLCVDCGYDHQNFLLNLARSACFPELSRIEFCDLDPLPEEDENCCVPFAHYEQLFQSRNLIALKSFFLRNAHLTDTELVSLAALRPEVDFAYQKRTVRISRERRRGL